MTPPTILIDALRWLLRGTASADTVDAIVGDLIAEWTARARTGAPRVALFAWFVRAAVTVVLPMRAEWRRHRDQTATVGRRRADIRPLSPPLPEDGDNHMQRLADEFRLAIRAVAYRPGSSLVVIVMLALGIGATTAVFSIVNQVLLEPLPYTAPEQLAVVWQNDRGTGTVREPASAPDFADLRDRSRSFAALAMYSGTTSGTLASDEGAPRRIRTVYASHDLLDVLGVTPQLGSGFDLTSEEPGAEPTIVLSAGLWRTAFNNDTTILGKTVRLGEVERTVIGILPDDLAFPPDGFDAWLPMPDLSNASRGVHSIHILGRLFPTISVEQAQRELTGLAAQFEAEHAENLNRGFFVEPLEDVVRGDVKITTWVIFAAVCSVLLIAFVNSANILLARGASRLRETALRSALGASAAKLVRQFLAEGLVLAGAAAALGVLLAHWGLRALVALASQQVLGTAAPRVDLETLAFAVVGSAAIAVGFGLLPAIQAQRVSVHDELKSGRSEGDSAAYSRTWLRRALVSMQLAMAVVLLVGAGLFLATIWNLSRVDPGFEPSNLLRMDTELPLSRYPIGRGVDPVEVHAFNRQVLDRLQRVPGVVAAALTVDHPLSRGFTTQFAIAGREVDPNQGELTIRLVSPTYFETAGLRVLAGEVFDDASETESLDRVVVNAAAEELLLDGDSAIGQQIDMWGSGLQVIGVVANERMHGVDQGSPPALYMSLQRTPQRGTVTMLVRTSVPPRQLFAALREAVASVDRELVLFNVATMRETLAENIARQRFLALSLTLFAGVALMIASLGVYGLLSYTVAQRQHEFGVRMALGANQRQVLRAVVSEGLAMVGVGLVAGLAGAFGLSRAVAGLVFGITATNPFAYLAVTSVLLAVALLACVGPARRAARIDPATFLGSRS